MTSPFTIPTDIDPATAGSIAAALDDSANAGFGDDATYDEVRYCLMVFCAMSGKAVGAFVLETA